MTNTIKASLIATYLERRASLKRFLVAQFRDETTAEDILQDMYLKLERSELTTPIQHQATFLYRMAHNLALDTIKKSKRASVREKDWQDTHIHEIGGDAVHDAPDPTARIDGKKRLQKLKAIIAEMPPQRKKVFVAHKLEGLTYAQIAERLGISRSGVEKHMISALKDVFTKLDGEEITDE